MKNISNLNFKRRILERLHLFLKEQDVYNQEEKMEEINRLESLLNEPLKAWLARQKGDHSGIQAAVEFSFAIDEIVSEIEFYELGGKHIEMLERAWNEFLLLNDGGGIAYSEIQRKKAKQPRSSGELRRLVAMVLRTNPDLKARELWPHLFSMLEIEFTNVREIVENKHQPKTWKYTYEDYGENKALKFKTFQNILSEIRKKLSR